MANEFGHCGARMEQESYRTEVFLEKITSFLIGRWKLKGWSFFLVIGT